MRKQGTASLVFALALAGCQAPKERLNAPPHGIAEATNPMQGTFVYMGDSALLADMTVSDMHFLPHRDILSTVGEQRIARLATLMSAYGGTVRLNSSERDEELLRKRMAAVVAALSGYGIDTTGQVVAQDLSGGRGMDAAQAALIMRTEGTYVPGKKSAGNDQTSQTVGSFGPSN